MNKILILVYVPFIEERYELFVPINKKVGTIKKIFLDSIQELSNMKLQTIQNLGLYNKNTGAIISNNIYIKDSGIRNGSELVLM